MLCSNTRHYLMMVSLFFLLVGVVGLSVGTAQDKPAAPTDSPKVKELLKERLETLREIAELTRKAYQAGAGPFKEVRQAQQAVLNAELELCESDKERIAILEKLVTAVREYEQEVARASKAGTIPASTPLRAKVARLEAETALERAKSKSSPPK